ncbi:branched-chain amino acid ABC transporter permease (plasmid) [Paracoccus versutus]|uniref:Branched-chain amino acid transport system permease protein n=2 Tax=Paracoccus TaxID=265 RepID=A0AAQ0HL41_PARVE|nr:branched-chain amino acid ABC transporter permease [Paracoccus versutus]REG54311.1 branched-chain amino acid transport system permease protein [Paracoccus versutus]WEJ80299.1 branched-chain amino acid ABC transporter permease [Paracoccus versutus]
MSTTLTNIHSRTTLPASLIVAATEIGGAILLGAFLLAESTPLVVALLAVMGALFAAMQYRPQIEEVIVAAFHDARGLATALAVAIVLIYPFFLGGNTYALHLLIVSLLYSVLALALNFQLGSANIPNFATGATYGIGAYTSALLAIHLGWSFWATLPAAAIVATVFGFLLGIPSMRTRDSYLALVTIAFGIVIHQMLNNLSWTGGPNGLVGIPAPSLLGHSFMRPIELFGFRLPSQANFYYLSAALLGLAILSAKRLHESRVGLAWNAIRADELAAKCQGINVVWYKILAFGVDAFLAAFAGTIYAFYISYISPDNFTFLVSVTIMTMVIVGGMDNTLGVILGAFLLTMLPEKLRVFSDYRLLFVSVVVILFLILRPKGLFPQRQRHYGGQR